MNESTLVIELPELSDEIIASLHDLLHKFIVAFESHDYHRLQRHDQRSSTRNENLF